VEVLVRSGLQIPACADLLTPLLTVIPPQLLAHHIAVRRGCDVDQPRNLAQSVTVEYIPDFDFEWDFPGTKVVRNGAVDRQPRLRDRDASLRDLDRRTVGGQTSQELFQGVVERGFLLDLRIVSESVQMRDGFALHAGHFLDDLLE